MCTLEKRSVLWYVDSEFFIIISRDSFPETADFWVIKQEWEFVTVRKPYSSVVVRDNIEAVEQKLSTAHSYFTVSRGKF